MTITNIIFDWGGVLTVGKHTDNVIRILEKKYGAKINGKEPLIGSYMDKIDQNKLTFKQFVAQVNERFGISLTVEEMRQVFKDAIISNKPVIELAKQLGKKYRVSMLSNNSKPTVALLRRFHNKMLALFEKKYFSCEIGMYKPQRKIYKLVLRQLKVEPENCIFIDDVIENIDAAKKLGINAIQFKSNAQLKRDLKSYGVFVR